MKGIFSTLRRFNRLIIVFIVTISLFSTYNIFMVDTTLDDLRFSLSQTALAYDIPDMNGMDIILNRSLLFEILRPPPMPSENVMALEFSKNIVAEGKSYRQLDDMQVSLEAAVKEKEDKRGIFLNALDKINSLLKKGIIYLTHLPQYLRMRMAKPITKEGLELLKKAQEMEKEGKLKEAATYYQDFVIKYTDYEKIALVELKLGYNYHKIEQYNRAISVYKEIIRSHFAEKEADIAQALLSQLRQREKLVARMNALLAKVAELSPKDKEAVQKAYYELGVINTELLGFEDAKKFFKRANNADPESELGVKSLFNSAWLSKQTNDLEGSLAAFKKIAQDKRNENLAINSLYQMADIYHKQGLYDDSIAIYLELAEKYKDAPFATLCLFQAASSYRYDLNDEEKAKEIFALLAKRYPNSLYARHLLPSNPVGIFITYLVPRATRVVAWRAGGLLCLTGYSGKLAKFKAKAEEEISTAKFNNWVKYELPETLGDIYVDIKGSEFKFLDDKATAQGNITMGKFNVKGEAEGKLLLTKEDQLDLNITRARLARIPIHPKLINNPLSGLSLLARKHFPVMVKSVSMKKKEVSGEGFGSRAILERLKKGGDKFAGIDIEISDIKDPKEAEGLYKLFQEKFPESGFSPEAKYDPESLFFDFFTRMYLYGGFKLLETVKDSKYDYERSIRTLGMLAEKQIRFGVNFTEERINASLNRFITAEFPWLVNNEFFFDVMGLQLHFTDKGEIEFKAKIGISHFEEPPSLNEFNLRAIAVLEIDKESRIPVLVFKEVTLNDRIFPVEKLNLVSRRCLEILKDGHIPFKLKEARISDSGIYLKGEGVKDFVMRVIGDPDIFTIYQIRKQDLNVAGIQRIGARPADITDFWRGRKYE